MRILIKVLKDGRSVCRRHVYDNIMKAQFDMEVLHGPDHDFRFRSATTEEELRYSTQTGHIETVL